MKTGKLPNKLKEILIKLGQHESLRIELFSLFEA